MDVVVVRGVVDVGVVVEGGVEPYGVAVVCPRVEVWFWLGARAARSCLCWCSPSSR